MIDEAAAAIRSGEVVGLPTDTVYGIAADPLDPEAIARLYELKGRPDHKPVGVLVASLEQAREIADIGETAAALARRHWPGALTLVVTPRVVMADWVGDRQLRTVGVRVPDHATARRLLMATGPLAVTSANRSGETEAMSDADARAVFGDEIRLYIPGTAPGGRASTVVDVTGEKPVVLRDGPVLI